MTTWAEAKLKGRQTVHEFFAVSAVFYSASSSTPTVDDDVVTVRVHDKQEKVGDLAGTNLSYAEQVERPTEAIFLVSEIEGRSLSRGSMFTYVDYAGKTSGYFVDSVNPRDGLTQSCYVTPMSAAELSGRLLPDGTTVP